MIWIVAFLLSIPAFVLLSVSMQKHQRVVFGSALQPHQSRLFRWLGHGLLIVCLAWCIILEDRWDFGMVVYTGAITLAALIAIWFVTFRPTVFRFLNQVARKPEDDTAIG